MPACLLVCAPPTWRLGGVIPGELHGDAEVVVDGELVAGQHLWPGKAVGLHHRSAAVPHGLAQRAARVDGPVQAHGRKERAQEHLRVGVAPLGQEGHPAAGLLLHLRHGLVVQQVGQPHLLVAHVVAQAQVGRYVHALRLLGVEAAVVEVVRLPAVVVVLVGGRGGQWQEKEVEKEEGEEPGAGRQAEGALGRSPAWALLSPCHVSVKLGANNCRRDGIQKCP